MPKPNLSKILSANVIQSPQDDERFGLDWTKVKLGETVIQLDTKEVFIVINLDELDNPAGFLNLTASALGVTEVVGTSGEIDITMGGTIATVSLPDALVFTGKTISDGTYNNPFINTPTVTGGIFNGGNFNNPIIGTPTVTGGTFDGGTFNTPSLVGAVGSLNNPTVTNGTFNGPTVNGGTFAGPTINNAVMVAPALGTPVSGVATNLTGTALGLTAGNALSANTVVTNANLTGDVTSVGNATTLATVNSAPGIFGSVSLVPVITVNAKGLVTLITTVAIPASQPPGNYLTALTGDVTATGPGSVAATLATVNANVGTFGSVTAVPIITVDAKGRITAVSTAAISAAAAAGTLTGTTLAANVVNASLNSITPAGGTLTISGLLAASNFSGVHTGSSSGTNTGDQTNISGSAGSAPAGTLTGTTIASGVTIASLTTLNPIGGTLNVNSAISASASITAGLYVFGAYMNMNHAVAQLDAATVFYSSTDDFIRKNNAAGMRNSLNIPDRTGGGASGTWAINVTGNAGSANSAGSSPAGTLSGTTIASNVTAASLNSITPSGGSFNVGGAMTATGQITGNAGIVSTAVTPYIVGSSATVGTVNYGSIGSASPVAILVNNGLIAQFTTTTMSLNAVFVGTVSNGVPGFYVRGSSSQLRVTPYFDATYQVLIESSDGAGTSPAPMTLVSSILRHRFGGQDVVTTGITGITTIAQIRITTVGEALRICNNAAYISWFSNDQTTRNGYIQGNAGVSFVIAAENNAPMIMYTGGNPRITIHPLGSVQFNTYTAVGYLKTDAAGNINTSPTFVAEDVSNVGFTLRSGTSNDSLLTMGYTAASEWFIRSDKDGSGTYYPLSVYVGGGLAYSVSTAQQITFSGQAIGPSFSSTSAADSTSPGTGAILTLGGLGVLKKAFFGDNVTTSQRFRSAPIGSSIVVSMWQDGAVAKIGTETAHDLLFVRNTLTMAQLGATGLEVFGTITTAAPTGGTAGGWKVGTVTNTNQPTHDRVVRVEIDGQVLFLAAHT